jgi:hypothetical protein
MNWLARGPEPSADLDAVARCAQHLEFDAEAVLHVVEHELAPAIYGSGHAWVKHLKTSAPARGRRPWRAPAILFLSAMSRSPSPGSQRAVVFDAFPVEQVIDCGLVIRATMSIGRSTDCAELRVPCASTIGQTLREWPVAAQVIPMCDGSPRGDDLASIAPRRLSAGEYCQRNRLAGLLLPGPVAASPLHIA